MAVVLRVSLTSVTAEGTWPWWYSARLCSSPSRGTLELSCKFSRSSPVCFLVPLRRSTLEPNRCLPSSPLHCGPLEARLALSPLVARPSPSGGTAAPAAGGSPTARAGWTRFALPCVLADPAFLSILCVPPKRFCKEIQEEGKLIGEPQTEHHYGFLVPVFISLG